MSRESLLIGEAVPGELAFRDAWVVGTGPASRALTTLISPAGASDVLDGAPYSNALVFAPELPAPRDCVSWTAASLESDVAARLLTLVTDLQMAVRRMLEHESGGRIVLVVPAAHALGESGNAAAGAMAGGIISMVRTLAMELKRKSIAVNLLFADLDDDLPHGLAAQLELLLDDESWITAQEIWIGNNLEMGKKRP